MTENNKKRGNSFRRIFPNLLFSNKNKEKSSIKDTSSFKLKAGGTSRSNQYQTPRYVIDNNCGSNSVMTEENDERIYENLSTAAFTENANDSNSNDLSSYQSSTSTLVSNNVKNINEPHTAVNSNKRDVKHIVARPQVPPKPYQDIYACPALDKHHNNYIEPKYPDIYYHSVEKLSGKISTLDEIEIYKASQAKANPASVGAEIKKVSTKFLISPKKEAEVRTIQPIRARSLSLDKNGSKLDENSRNMKKERFIEKPYNYSAPTSPMPVGHKVPNMPTTVSPYERVKQYMIEAEERRNSLSRLSYTNKSSPSPRSLYYDNISNSFSLNSPTKEDSMKKQKTRQKVEAFYWQKLKELKQKEDDFLLRQSLDSSSKVYHASYSYSNCSTPTPFIVEPRSCSLPRGRDLNYASQRPIASSPFMRGTPERKTDSYIKLSNYKTSELDNDRVQYRNPEKIYGNVSSKNHLPMFQRGSLTKEINNVVQQPKRVSFEGKQLPKNLAQQDVGSLQIQCKNNQCKNNRNNDLYTVNLGPKDLNKPPLPPVRTTSVLGSVKNNLPHISKRLTTTVDGTRSVYPESESGSEASEIQRIMHSNSRKGKFLFLTIDITLYP